MVPAAHGRPLAASDPQPKPDDGADPTATGVSSTSATSPIRQITGSAPLRRCSGAARLNAQPYSAAASSTSAIPSPLECSSPNEGDVIATTPAKPTSRPTTRQRPGHLAHDERGDDRREQRRRRGEHPGQRRVDPLHSDRRRT